MEVLSGGGALGDLWKHDPGQRHRLGRIGLPPQRAAVALLHVVVDAWRWPVLRPPRANVVMYTGLKRCAMCEAMVRPYLVRDKYC